MRMLIPLFLLLFTQPTFARGKLWVSNKLEIGYDKVFVSNQVTFDSDKFTKNGFAAGLKIKLSDDTSLKAFYLLENAFKDNWKNNHFLGIKFDLKLQ
jgi:hypothetical protein